MGVCFICDIKLLDEQTQVCTSITPHGKLPFPEKIAELMGEEFVVISTPDDHMCKRCTSLLLHMDNLENDVKRVKNALLSFIKKKHGILSRDQPEKAIDVVNGNLKTSEHLEAGRKKNPFNNDHSSKRYKCGFCPYISKNLQHVRSHMRIHSIKEKADQAAAAAKPLPLPPKKKIYKCEVCSKTFNSRTNCLSHIKKEHNRPTKIAFDEKNKAEDSAVSSSTNFKQDTLKSQDNQQKESAMDVDDNAGQRDQNEGKKPAELEDSQISIELHNLEKSMLNQTPKKFKLEPQEMYDDAVNEVGKDENKIEITEIESMLATIHNV